MFSSKSRQGSNSAHSPKCQTIDLQIHNLTCENTHYTLSLHLTWHVPASAYMQAYMQANPSLVADLKGSLPPPKHVKCLTHLPRRRSQDGCVCVSVALVSVWKNTEHMVCCLERCFYSLVFAQRKLHRQYTNVDKITTLKLIIATQFCISERQRNNF